MFEVSFVRTIAKRFVGRTAATAQRHDGATLKAIGIALDVNNFKVAFYFYGAVAVYSKFGGCHDGVY